MELLILVLLTLILDILPDRLFRGMLPHGANMIAIGPKFATPQLLFDPGHPSENFSRGETLDDRDDFRWTIAWHGLHQKMYMILIHANFKKLNLVTIGNLQTHCLQHLVHLFIDHGSSIFRGTDKMIDQDGHIMAFSNQVTYAAILSRRTAAGYSTR